ncbi:MAG: hypothetical protein AB1898_02770 [Acidobacteriota bacterium]
MRRTLAWICYGIGGFLVVLFLHMVIACELLAVMQKVDNYRFALWPFLFQIQGHHSAYPNGYLLHWFRDLAVLGIGLLLIRSGREQYSYKKSRPILKSKTLLCPACRRKTAAEAYCRFCGYNLVMMTPSAARRVPMKMWQVSLLAYGALSVFLLVLNLIVLQLGLA